MQRAAAVGKAFERIVWLLAALAAAYLLLAGYYGYAVGRAMHDAKRNPLIAVVAGAIGREGSERYAITKARIPSYIVEAPTFWIALRLNE
ncbi:MAG TPA: hypothetical protein VGF86_01845 [Candidatus Tumulicola sp.]|jgi:hypothetical protein